MFRIIKRIIKWTGEFKTRLYKGFVYSLLNTIFTSIPIMLAGFAINLVLLDINGEKELKPEWILIILCGLVISIILRFLTAYRRAVLQESIAFEVSANQRIRIGNILKKVSLGFFEKNSSGDLNAAITNDLSYMEMFGMKMIDIVVNGYISAITMVVCLSFYSIPIAIVSMIGIILSGITLRILGSKSKKNAPFHMKSQEHMTEATLEYIKGLQVVKAFGQQGAAINNICNSYNEAKNINIKIEKQFAKYNCIHLFILKITSVIIVMLAAYYAIIGTMSIPNMVMMSIFSFVIFAHVEQINNATHVLEMIDNTMNKLELIEDTDFAEDNCEDIELDFYDIKFDKVKFGYSDSEIIKDISFTIAQNTTTAIVGPSGSGKSTICNLIAGFYKPQGGKIEIGGKDISTMTSNSLLKNISMVFQNVYLFHDTVINNIKFGNPKASYEEVIEASKKACCHEFIKSLPNGYDTVIGEGGSSLSGGEKQRISIARAILKDAPIIILDEATASVDPENEHYIQNAINELTSGKTIIIIAHRLATIKHANQILVLNKGEIVQKGIHKELKNEEGLYKKFINIRKEAENWNIV